MALLEAQRAGQNVRNERVMDFLCGTRLLAGRDYYRQKRYGYEPSSRILVPV